VQHCCGSINGSGCKKEKVTSTRGGSGGKGGSNGAEMAATAMQHHHGRCSAKWKWLPKKINQRWQRWQRWQQQWWHGTTLPCNIVMADCSAKDNSNKGKAIISQTAAWHG